MRRERRPLLSQINRQYVTIWPVAYTLFVNEVTAMKNFTTILSLVLLLICSGASLAQDAFSNIQCGSDIAKALTGRPMRNEKVATLENRHKDLGLKDLGGDEISDGLFSASWKICGGEYMLIETRSVVRDALKIPEHSKQSPEFIGQCQVKGAKIAGTIIAILNNEEGKDNLSAKAAWKIDTKTAKFVKMPTEGLLCPRDGIITADGGH
jgi:hypothetical protein